ncbi:MAG: toll/interleukin-1 receptor domain-containing protein [Oscillospiraceae bacterium]|nr:toll/interleukin-1 receptor domain-containing protein [Oscillospiraceae bacterium]
MQGKLDYSKKYNVFLSYRRDGGEAMAILLRDRLAEKGYRVFLDVENLNAGTFNDKLLEIIDGCTDFVLVCSAGCLDRCINEGDWVHKEISHAYKAGKNVVPVMLRGFEWPEALPEDIEILRMQNGVSASNSEFFEAVIDRLADKFLQSSPKRMKKLIFKIAKVVSAVIGVLALTVVLAVGIVTLLGQGDNITQILYVRDDKPASKELPSSAGEPNEAYDEQQASTEHDFIPEDTESLLVTVTEQSQEESAPPVTTTAAAVQADSAPAATTTTRPNTTTTTQRAVTTTTPTVTTTTAPPVTTTRPITTTTVPPVTTTTRPVTTTTRPVTTTTRPVTTTTRPVTTTTTRPVTTTTASSPVTTTTASPVTTTTTAPPVTTTAPPVTHNISVSAGTGGSASGGGAFNNGSSVTVIANAEASHNFDGWYSGGAKVSDSLSYTFAATANTALEARFSLKEYTVSFVLGTFGGVINWPGENSRIVRHGEQVGMLPNAWRDDEERIDTFHLPPFYEILYITTYRTEWLAGNTPVNEYTVITSNITFTVYFHGTETRVD